MQYFLLLRDISIVDIFNEHERQAVMIGKEGQQEAYDLQVKIDTYKDMLYKIAFMQLKNEQDAEDIVQEVFCQYYRSGKVFESEEHEKAWFIKVTLNACRKVWRSAWYRHNAPLPDYEMPGESRMESDFLKKERQEEVLRLVLSLPAKYREVIHLFYYEELSVREICAATGRQESTVTSQLTRGRDILRKKLKEEYGFEQF